MNLKWELVICLIKSRKTIKVIAVLLIMSGFGFNIIQAQSLVVKDFAVYLMTQDGIYPAVDMMGVFTPSGNILHKQIFMIDKDDSLVPKKGMNKVFFETMVLYAGKRWLMYAEGKVFPNGKCLIVFHTNGAGSGPHLNN